METALYWVNYVAKHNGAKFMRTAAVDMPFYKYYLLDVISFIIALILCILLIIYRITKFVLSKIFQKKLEEKLKKT